MKKYRYIIALLLTLPAWGCIDMNESLPDIVPSVSLFELQGMTGAAVIDTENRVITVEMVEGTDMSNIPVQNFTATRDAVIEPAIVAGSTVDLSSGEASYTLTTNKKFIWTVKGTQALNRAVTADKLISAHFNLSARSVLMLFSPSQSLDNITVTQLKLGYESAVITPDFTTVHDFTRPVRFTVADGSTSEEWTVAAEHATSNVVTGDVNAFARFALVTGDFPGEGTPTFCYRRQGTAEWTTFPAGEVTIDGSSFSARIGGLTEDTAYEVYAVNDTEEGETRTFTTESVDPGWNLSFEEWNQVTYGIRKCWYPNATQDNPWWDSGNRGANTLREENPTSPEASLVINGKAVKMASTKILTMFAAGNLYTGTYVQTVTSPSLGGMISMGRPYTARPTRMTGWYNYSPGVVDNAKEPYQGNMGQPDECSIYVLLADWAEPYIVNTAAKVYLDLDHDPGIIAIGSLFTSEPTDGYEEFSLDLEYRSLTRRPTHILIVCSASRYGDYFTGSTSSVLYVDELALGFD